MESKPKVTTGGSERLIPTTELYVPAFAADPVINWLLCSLPNQSARLAYLPAYFQALLKAAALNGASFDETGNYECCCVMMPPGRQVDNTWTLIPAGIIGCLWKLGFSGVKRMLLEYTPLADAAKEKGLKKGEKFFYVFFIATREDCRGRGLASPLIRHCQTVAQEAKLPLWLEATTAYSRDIYARLGFVTVDEVVLGKEVVNADGLRSPGGQGVKLWPMVWRAPIDSKKQEDS